MVELALFAEKDTVYWNKNRKTIFYRYYDLESKLRYLITHSSFSNKFVSKFADGNVIGQYDTYEQALDSFTYKES